MGELTSRLHLRGLTASGISSMLLNTIQLIIALIVIGLAGANFNATSDHHSAAVSLAFPSVISA